MLKLNAGLTFLNSYSFGGNQGTIARGLSFDGQHLYSVGQTMGTSDLDPSPNSVSAYTSNSQRPFIQKLDFHYKVLKLFDKNECLAIKAMKYQL